MLLSIFSVLGLVVLSFSGVACNGHERHGPPKNIFQTDTAGVKMGKLKAKVDNFDPKNKKKFTMRYYMNEQKCTTPGCPLVIYVGGEWDISGQEGWLKAGQIYDIANAVNGALYYLEHRYYGKTTFTPDFTTKSLNKLHSRQALLDLKNFIDMLHSIEKYKNSPVILFGCSYSAALTGWMKQMYPEVITVSYSSSGPFHAKDSMFEYLQVITKDIESKSPECKNILYNGIRQLEKDYDSDPQKGNTVRKLLGYLPENNPTKLDKAALFQQFAVTWGGMGQENPGKISTECQNLININGTDAQKVAQYHKPSPVGVYNVNYQTYKSMYMDTSLKGTARLWFYQQCNEFGWFQTTETDQQAFGNSVITDFYHQLCRDVFSSSFTDQVLLKKQKETNNFYGGKHPKNITHAVFVYGTIDPWAPMGIEESLNDKAIRFEMKGGDHCWDMFAVGANQDIQRVKKSTIDQIKQWIDELKTN